MITVIGNFKGGSGKSTVTFNLAVWLGQHHAKVVTFDLDPQKTLTDVTDIRREEEYPERFSLIHDVDLLADYKGKKKTEVVVDVGTSDMIAMRKALALADRIVVPVPPSQADIWSTQRFLGIVNEAAGGKKKEIHVFVNRADTHVGVRESDEAEEALGAMSGVKLLPQRLYQRTAYRRSFSEGLGVFELEPSSKAAKEFYAFTKLLYPKYTVAKK